MSGARLDGALLNGCNLCGANLTNAALSGARLYAAPLHNAVLVDTSMEGAMGLGVGPRAGCFNADLKGARVGLAWDVGDLSDAKNVSIVAEGDGVRTRGRSADGELVPFSQCKKGMEVRLTPPGDSGQRRVAVVVGCTSKCALVHWASPSGADVLQANCRSAARSASRKDCYVSQSWWDGPGRACAVLVDDESDATDAFTGSQSRPSVRVASHEAMSRLLADARRSSIAAGDRPPPSQWFGPRPPSDAFQSSHAQTARRLTLSGLQWAPSSARSLPRRSCPSITAGQVRPTTAPTGALRQPVTIQAAKRHYGDERWGILTKEEKLEVLRGATPLFARKHLKGCCTVCGDTV
eukprot:TRINITY_DN18019_c0_g1_i1.p1 TRINITY_DN18019_c0_g1~~TRINITY_DN18019_c0_g1_i1.p1  ORF type:complete len:360 (+),score=70.34 TRINITY_DN18019_c0_g1_i1:30-1082(+)